MDTGLSKNIETSETTKQNVKSLLLYSWFLAFCFFFIKSSKF